MLSPAEVCAGALDLRQTFLREVDFPGSDSVPVAPPPARLSHGTVPLARPPLLGEHSEAVLEDYGFGSDEIAGLKAGGVI